MSLLLLAICLVVGLLIGAVGIGGVLLVPALAFVIGIDVHRAIPACMLAYLPTGIVGAVVYARHGSIRRDMIAVLCAGAIPAAFAGSLLLGAIPPSAILILIAALMVVSGVDALYKVYKRQPSPESTDRPGRGWLATIGLVTGFGSALTGTGGPLILVPSAVFIGLPVLTAIGLSQVIQVPIALFASAGNWLAGSLDLRLALNIAVGLVVGTLVGASLVHRMPEDPLLKIIAWFLVLVGGAIALRLVLT